MQQDEASKAQGRPPSPSSQKASQKASQEEPSTESGQQANDTAAEDPAVYEETHVHSVYESIADHFSATRYSPWPLVARFLDAQPAGSLGLDVGCGNGKYLSGGTTTEPPGLYMLGSDRSAGLATLARTKHAAHRPGADVLLADSLALPFRDRCADFAICIAVVHHLSTRARRQAAVRELLRCVRPRRGEVEGEPAASLSSGSVLVYVWALEQASSRRGWAAGGDQDLLVPWVKTMKDKTKDKTKEAKGASKKKKKSPQPAENEAAPAPPAHEPAQESAQEPAPQDAPPTFHRYYHLYREGELEEDVAAAGGRVVAHGYERDNWWVVADIA